MDALSFPTRPRPARHPWFLLLVFALAGASALPAQAPGSSAVARAQSQLLIKRKAGSALSPLAVLPGATTARTFPRTGGFEVLRLPPGMPATVAIQLLQRSGAFTHVEPDAIVRLQATPNEPRFAAGDLWSLHNSGGSSGLAGADIQAPEAWDIRSAAPNVIVALVDSGVRQTHEDLAPNLWRNTAEIPGNGLDDDGNGVIDDVHGFNAHLGNGEPEDDLGHGTHVAGIIGAAGNNARGVVGVAWRVQIMPTKFTDPDGNGAISDAIACLDYARANGAQIVNASWGAPAFESAALRAAIVALREAGILFVTVAGNDHADNDATPYFPGAYGLDNMIVVTATDRTDQLASFANHGARTVHLGAPGHEILSAWVDGDAAYHLYSGGSMAVPHVSGALALLRAEFPAETHQQLIQRILGQVDPLPSLAQTTTGGRLNLFRALGAPAPPIPAVTLAASDPVASEAGPDTAVFTFTRGGPLVASLLVKYAAGGTAANGLDYESIEGTALIPATQSSVTVIVRPLPDAATEGNETVILSLANDPGYTLSGAASATATIADAAAIPPAWQSSDIGAVGAAGSADEAAGVVTLSGSGADIWDSADEFRFRYQAWSGDGEIIARVIDLTPTHGWAKAGVMFRETLTAGSRHAFMCVSAANGVALQRRPATGGGSASTGGPGLPPRWLRLVREGSTLRGYESPDGVTWTLIASVTVAMPATLHVGLAVTSHQDGVVATARFDHVTLTANTPPPATLAAPGGLVATSASASSVSLSWTDNSTGETEFQIERSTDNAIFSASGTAPADATSAVVGGLDAATAYFFRVRAAQGAATSPFSNTAGGTTGPAPPASGWLTSDVGAVGAAGSASESGRTTTLSGSGADIWDNADEFRFRYQSLTGDGELLARVTQVGNTNGWAKAGLMMRETTATGSRHVLICVSSENGIAFQRRIAANGASASTSGSGSQAPRWLRLVRSGNVFTGYESSSGTSWTPVGSVTLTLGATLLAGPAVTSHNDGALCTATFEDVALAGAASGPPAAPANLAAQAASAARIDLSWLDQAVNETGFEIERSLDGATFALVATTAANVTSHADTGRAASTTYTYRVRAVAGSAASAYSNPAAATTAAGGPAPIWSHVDIGDVGLAGSDDAGGSSITVRGAGGDIWGGADAFRFLYQTRSGDCTVEARVASLTDTNAWAKAGVMIRETLAPGGRNVFVLLTPANGIAVQARLAPGIATVFRAGPWGATPPHWVRLVRTGGRIAAYGSADGVAWLLIETHDFPIGAPVHVGFAVTAHDVTRLNTSVFGDPFIAP